MEVFALGLYYFLSKMKRLKKEASKKRAIVKVITSGGNIAVTPNHNSRVLLFAFYSNCTQIHGMPGQRFPAAGWGSGPPTGQEVWGEVAEGRVS